MRWIGILYFAASVVVKVLNAQTGPPICISLFESVVSTCGSLDRNGTDLYEHAMDEKSQCSQGCLDAMENLLRRTSSGCRDYWDARLAEDVDVCSPECVNLRMQQKACTGAEIRCYPLGKRDLYERFLQKCQDQRRQGYMSAFTTDPVQQPVTEDAWGNYIVEAAADIVLNSQNTRAFVGVGQCSPLEVHKHHHACTLIRKAVSSTGNVDPKATFDVDGEVMADSIETLSINGWNASTFRKSIA
eukprot:SAG31_NODE_12600_length_930_cov_1.419976_1_plen_243_part_10